MHRQLPAVVLIAAFLTASCSDTDARLAATEPSPLSGSKTASLAISPVVVAPQIFRTPPCVGLPPFGVHFNLNVQAGDMQNLLITSVRAEFRDSSGMQAPAVTLPAPVPTAQFGSMLVDARSQRDFPFTFACGIGRTGTIVVIVDTRDGFGQTGTTRLLLQVR
jgi:hypothetical protein